MANWKYNLKLKDLRDKCDAGEITVTELGKQVAKRIKNHNMYKNANEEDREELDAIIDNFECTEDNESFNDSLRELYDFGDIEVKPFGKWPPNKMCWIEFAV